MPTMDADNPEWAERNDAIREASEAVAALPSDATPQDRLEADDRLREAQQVMAAYMARYRGT